MPGPVWDDLTGELRSIGAANFFSLLLPGMVPAEGFEPPTSTLRKSCSTAELRRQPGPAYPKTYVTQCVSL